MDFTKSRNYVRFTKIQKVDINDIFRSGDPLFLVLTILLMYYLIDLPPQLIKIANSSQKIDVSSDSLEVLQRFSFNRLIEDDLYRTGLEGSWPEKGKIHFNNVSVKYLSQSNFGLRGVEFMVKDKEKIGILGPAGSGKSTLLNCAMRMLELRDRKNRKTGRIVVDGVDISTLGLHELRRNLAIIPQEPFLLKGSLRFNIDPYRIHSDPEILEALNLVDFFATFNDDDYKKNLFFVRLDTDQNLGIEMDDAIASSYWVDIKKQKMYTLNQLDFHIEQRGRNLTQKQKQLICLVRVLLRAPKILLMDQMLDSYDPEFDALVEKVIHSELKDSTVLKVSQSPEAVIKCDRVIVLENGIVVQEGVPFDLIREKGYLSDFIAQQEAGYSERMMKMVQDYDPYSGLFLGKD